MLPSDIPTPALYTFRSSFLANDSPIISAFVAMVKARGLPPPRQGGESFVNFASRIDSWRGIRSSWKGGKVRVRGVVLSSIRLRSSCVHGNRDTR